MSYIIKYEPNGRITQCMSAPKSTIEAESLSYKGLFLLSSFAASNEHHFVRDGRIIEKGDKPSESYVFDFEYGNWSFDLQIAKSRKWDQIKGFRTAQEFGTFDWGGYTFQCDEVSQRRIQGAVQLAAINPDFMIDWTLEDNSVVNLNAQNMIDIGVTLASHVSACHARGRILRSEIDSATTEQELEGINW